LRLANLSQYYVYQIDKRIFPRQNVPTPSKNAIHNFELRVMVTDVGILQMSLHLFKME
jgi:hypothetical protein